MEEPNVRLAREDDVAAINDIYNHFVLTCTCTYQEQPDTPEIRRQWLARHTEKHPVTVASLNQQIVGWGSLSPYHARSAYRFTVEDSVYIHPQFQGCGVGSLILKDLISRAQVIGHRAIIAGIDSLQAGSIALHSRYGFQQVGHLKQVGFKFSRWLDVVYMELLLK